MTLVRASFQVQDTCMSSLAYSYKIPTLDVNFEKMVSKGEEGDINTLTTASWRVQLLIQDAESHGLLT